MLGLSEKDIQSLLPRFINDAEKELEGVSLKPDASTEGNGFKDSLWALDILDTHLDEKAAGPEKLIAVDRTILHRFLAWASNQPAQTGHTSLPAVDNLTTFSPYATLGAIGRLLDYRDPAEQFFQARRARRKIIMHVGPTNSGKTYNALVALAKAKSGVYAGPLRLLAHEIYDRFNKGLIAIPQEPGKPPVSSVRKCNLLTGEEKRIEDEDAPLTSATVEMINISKEFEVVVLDEIQMIADPQRGDAWTQAVLGVKAKELHLCGEETAVDLIRSIAAETGDELIVNRYERLTPLHTASQSLKELSQVRPGDCVVAFSRAHLFTLRSTIEKSTGLKCAMVYGALPPEVRAEQAQLFNDPESGYNVLVASDAVGMGLNLKIKRIVFASLSKWDGTAEVDLSVSQTKQIAGRAGRFGLHDKQARGEVATLYGRDMKQLKSAMAAPIPYISHAFLKPSTDTVEQLATLLPPTTSFQDLMSLLDTGLLMRAPYTPEGGDGRPSVAMELVKTYCGHLSARECLDLLHMPMNYRIASVKTVGTNIARIYAESGDVTLDKIFAETSLLQSLDMVKKLKKMSLANGGWSEARRKKIADELATRKHVALSALESLHKAVTGYLWLSWRRPSAFADRDKASELKEESERAIEFYLTLMATTGTQIGSKAPRRGPKSLPIRTEIDIGDGVDGLAADANLPSVVTGVEAGPV